MAAETAYCAICHESVPLDGDHVEVDAETVYVGDRNTLEDYVLHPDCWNSVTQGWM